MLDPGKLEKSLLATCAIAITDVPPSEYLKTPAAPLLKVIGTGFRIRPGTVLTARHVVRDTLSERAARHLHPEHAVAIFYRPVEELVEIRLNPLVSYSAFHHDGADIGVFEIKESSEDDLSILPGSEGIRIRLGDPIYIPGYPFGSHLLYRSLGGETRQYRVGPVIQQGHVSAIAPYGSHKQVDRLLLDVHTAKGASGSPVLDSVTHELLGLHESGREDVTAFALPLSRERIEVLCRSFDEAKAKSKGESVEFQIVLPHVPRLQ